MPSDAMCPSPQCAFDASSPNPAAPPAAPHASPTWSERAGQQLRLLMDRPALLLLFLLAANAVTRPYASFAHDARLYSAQVLNYVEDGIYKNDLFFRYGSQDQYSIFSTIMAPVVRLMGLELAFFVGYLASNAVFFNALAALVRLLVKDRLLALISLVYLAIVPLGYGGLHVFHVHETFLTPRLPAVGLVVFGLARLLQGRRASSLACMVLAFLLHPIMAVGGLLTWGAVCLIDKLGWRLALCSVVVAVLAVAFFLATPSLAARVLGEMDETWRDAVLRPTPFNFTSEWEIDDWCNILFCFVGLAGGVWIFCSAVPNSLTKSAKLDDRRRIEFLVVAGVVGIAAILGTIVAENLPYALPFQGQPYRALWILKLLQPPLCFLLASRLFCSRNAAVSLLAFVPLGFLLNSGPPMLWHLEAACTLYFLPFAIVVIRGLGTLPRRSDWLMRSLAVSLVLGEVAWGAYRESVMLDGLSVLLEFHDVFALAHLLLFNLGIVPWMLLLLGATAWFLCRGGSPRGLGLASLAICLLMQTVFFAIPNIAFVREYGTRHLRDSLFARDFVRQQQGRTRNTPTIYSPFGRLEQVWLEMKMNSFFDWCQTSGVIFHRQTALEGRRRALVVGPFETGRFREGSAFLSPQFRRQMERFFGRDLESPEPTLADLARLCQEEELDYAVLRHRFGNLHAATNGSVYIYDCRRVRAALGQPRPGQADARVGHAAAKAGPIFAERTVD